METNGPPPWVRPPESRAAQGHLCECKSLASSGGPPPEGLRNGDVFAQWVGSRLRRGAEVLSSGPGRVCRQSRESPALEPASDRGGSVSPPPPTLSFYKDSAVSSCPRTRLSVEGLGYVVRRRKMPLGCYPFSPLFFN